MKDKDRGRGRAKETEKAERKIWINCGKNNKKKKVLYDD